MADNEGSPIKGKFKILLADDVEINVLLLKILLTKIFPECEIIEAKDGKQALETVKSARPDFIFMDIQMPVMDGYTSAIQIRDWEEKNELKRVPIIAITAGVVVSEKNAFINAGMDGYLTKPIDAKKIEVLVAKFLNPSLITEEAELSVEKGKNHFDKDALLKKLDNEEDTFQRWISIGRKQFTEDLDMLSKAVMDGDSESIEYRAHKLKGAALTLTCITLSEYAAELEALASGNENDILRVFEKIQNEIKLLINESWYNI